MKKKYFKLDASVYRNYRKFYNLQKRLRTMLTSGEFYSLTLESRKRLLRRLQIFYKRLTCVLGEQKLRWAGTAMAVILGASVAQAQFADPVSWTGFQAPAESDIAIGDVDADGDLDLVCGDEYGGILFIKNDSGNYSPGSPNPFSAINFTYNTSPTLGDVDDDGDIDLIVGEWDGTIHYYENDGGVFTEQTGIDNPFDALGDLGTGPTPELVDVDGDNDLDLVVGDRYAGFLYYQNDGGAFTQQIDGDNPFDGIDIGTGHNPTFGDLDDDGDLDMVTGRSTGIFHYFINNSGVFAEISGASNPFDEFDVGSNSAPLLFDFDGDGDIDLASGADNNIYINFYRNDGGAFAEKRGTANPFEGILGSSKIDPAFVDRDGDGDLDIAIGQQDGTITYYENTDEGFIPMEGTDNPFDGIDVGSDATIAFGDIDEDGDNDCVLGASDGSTYFYEKDGSDFFGRTGVDNPIDGISSTYSSSPCLADYDGDGDLDFFIGTQRYDGANYLGTLDYYRNLGSDFLQQTGSANPFEEIFETDTLSSPLTPTFADVDMDGDLDLYVGSKYALGGGVFMSENDGGTFQLISESDSPIDSMFFGYSCSPEFADIDNDGDLDLFVGANNKYADEAANLMFIENKTYNPKPPVNGIEEVTVKPGSVEIYAYNRNIVLDAGMETIDIVEVYSVTGNLMYAKNVNTEGRYEFILNDANTGMYIVRAYSNNEISNAKVLIR